MEQLQEHELYPVKFAPIAKERIWGGYELAARFGVQPPEPIGEYWVLSGHPNGTSVISNGPFAGRSLVQLTERFPAYLGVSPQQRFPLMIKFLEANADLSVQVHPDDAYALQHESDYGKTEAWYVLKAPADGKVVYGHRFADKHAYAKAIQGGAVQDCLNYQSVKPGDLVFVPARTLHALLAGTQVIEVQQTSDVTYRVYDWDRLDQNGQPRDLHVEKAGKVMDFAEPMPDHATSSPVMLDTGEAVVLERLVSCAYFTMDKLTLQNDPCTLTSGHMGNPDILIIADGAGQLRYRTLGGVSGAVELQFGDTVLVPGTMQQYDVVPSGGLTLLRAYY